MVMVHDRALKTRLGELYTLSSDAYIDNVGLPLDAVVSGIEMWNQG